MKNLFLIGLILVIILMSGCKEIPQSIPEEGDVANPTVTLEATILSIITKDVCPVDPEDPCPFEKNPLDWGEIRIDKVIEYHGSWWTDPRVKYKPLVEGENRRNIGFAYSTRPAKVKCIEFPESDIDVSKKQSSEESTESIPKSIPLRDFPEEPPRSTPRENGFFIFTYHTGKCPTEKVLPGLKEGDKIRFTSTYAANELIVGEYEIIS